MISAFDKDFLNFEKAKKAVLDFCRKNFHPIHISSKEKVSSYNKKLKEDKKIEELAPEEVYACRWNCKHYGHPKKSPILLKRPNQKVLPMGCRMSIYVSYNMWKKCFQVKKCYLEHNHPIGKSEYEMYSQERQPKGKILAETNLLLLHGVKPTLISDHLHDCGLKVTGRDLQNIKQRLRFKGSSLDEVKKILDSPVTRYHIDTDIEGKVECITWTTLEQLELLKRFPEVIMVDGTYKINNMSMPLYTLLVVDQNETGRPVMQALVYRENQVHLEMLLARAKEWADESTFINSIFMVDKAQAEIAALRAAFPENRILLSHFQVVKTLQEEIKKCKLRSEEREMLFTEVRALLYGNVDDNVAALNNIHSTSARFHAYFLRNWLKVSEMFLGHHRRGLMHLDVHNNNKLEKYHRSLKASRLSPHLSPGQLILRIMQVNRVHISNTRFADFEQRLKSKTILADILRGCSQKVSDFMLNHLVEQHSESLKPGLSLVEENVKDQGKVYEIENGTCICNIATTYMAPCSHTFFYLKEKQIGFSEELISKRWFVFGGDNGAPNQSTSPIAPVKVSCDTHDARYSTALAFLQPLASHLADMKPVKFEKAMLWLENVSQQGLSGEWELALPLDEDSELLPSTSSEHLPTTKPSTNR